VRGFLAALGFLTVFPVPGRVAAGSLAAAPGHFPAVGLFIGLALVAAQAGLSPRLPAPVLAALLLALLVAITGGLHLDGLADTCDGFFAPGAGRERRLEIMRDSRVGSHGVTAVAIVLLLQYGALSSLPQPAWIPALLLMTVLSRWAVAFVLLVFPYGRREGMGSAFHGGPVYRSLVGSTLFTLGVSALVAGVLGCLLMLVVAPAAWAAGRVLLARLPGLTGDSYGAVNEVVQALVLVLVVAATYAE
jgi:adenosylcobinamide-GDP ribazoletransferase